MSCVTLAGRQILSCLKIPGCFSFNVLHVDHDARCLPSKLDSLLKLENDLLHEELLKLPLEGKCIISLFVFVLIRFNGKSDIVK